MRNSILSVAATLAVIVLVGCQSDEFESMDHTQSDAVVNFTASVAITSADLQTKASVSEMISGETTLVSEDGEVNLPLSFKSTPGIDGIAEPSDASMTRGNLVNDNENGDLSNIALPSSINSFKVAAWTGTTVSIPANTKVTYADGIWSTATSYIWKKGETKTFVAYTNLPESGSGITSTSDCTQTLTHTVPTDVSAQKDILMGYYSGDGNGSGTAAITFYHPLTAVKFIVGDIDADVVISKISIKGVYASGNTTQSAAGTSFAWTGTSATTISQTITGSLPSEGEQIGEAFLLIPQAFSEDAAVEITFNATVNGNPTELVATLTSGQWKAGYTNTYILGYEYDLKLSVTGEVLTNYQGEGSTQYSVSSNGPWKIQYTMDNGSTWNDAVANTLINDWIKFDVVCGDGNDEVKTVNATVIGLSNPTSKSTDHSEILQSATPKGTAYAPYDLSMHTIYGEPRATGKPVTANSYVINASGWYAFPLVYGNAIDYTKNTTDGINVEAYNPTPYYAKLLKDNPYFGMLKPFKSATGDITSPFITGATSAYPLWEDLPDYAIITNNPTDCKVISSDEANTMGLALGGRCGYVIFHVNNENLNQGNAVIAAKDSEGTILWSWHIWVTDDDLTCKNVINKDGTFNKGMMPVNLGWVDFGSTKSVYEGRSLQIRFVQTNGDNIKNEVFKTPKREEYLISGGVAGQCPLYQWGRKDPFIRAQGLDDNSEISSGLYSGSFIDVSKQATGASGCDFSFSVKNPNYFLLARENLSPYWYSTGAYYNLWDARQNIETADGSIEGHKSSPYKSVYDPCPPGFQVPQLDVFTGFSKNDKKIYDDSETKVLAYDFKTSSTGHSTILFPMTGTRSSTNGSIKGLEGYDFNAYWTALNVTSEAYKGSTLQIIPSLSVFNCYYILDIAAGCPIRPVEE